MLKRGAIAGGTLVWAVPTVQTLSKAALAATVGSPEPTPTPDPTPTNTPDPTPSPTPDPTPTNTPDPTPSPTPDPTPTQSPTPTPTGNACASIRSHGWWKNYANQMTDAQFYAYLKAAPNFGPTFAALSQASAIAQAKTMFNLPGNNVAMMTLVSSLNVARDPYLGSATMVGYSGTLNQLLALAYAHNGSGNNSPYTNNGAVTAADKDVIGYVSAGGEFDSITKCRLKY
jgi:hypothetical protein